MRPRARINFQTKEEKLMKKKDELEKKIKEVQMANLEKKKMINEVIETIGEVKKAKRQSKKATMQLKNLLNKIPKIESTVYDCPKCKKAFSEDGRAPKILHCGDMICNQCLSSSTRALKCAVCRVPIPKKQPIKDNYALKSFLF